MGWTYRNTVTGRTITRPDSDPWLEASSGWELLNDQTPTPDTGHEEDDTWRL